MRVLILDFDLFATVGGGQTFYRSVVLRNPDTEFYYLRRCEPATISKPSNAHPIDYKEKYPPTSLLHFCDITVPYWTQPLYLEANNIASSVAGQMFDIVDYPDYKPIGVFLRNAFQSHGVTVKRISVALHGLISTTEAMNWEGNGVVCRQTRMIEELQYAVADIRYFISERYQHEWRAICPLPSHCLDPLQFFALPGHRRYLRSSGAPSLNFIGRTEKRKGPHVFLQLLWWLPASSFSAANIIGPACFGSGNMSSSQRLEQMCRNRDLKVNFLGAMSMPELQHLFASRSVTFVPSLYDTFNLVALESLFSGCPTVIGSGAGVIDYLQERFPKIPFEIMDMSDFYASVPRVEGLLRDYEDYRQSLSDSLEECDYTACGPTLPELYSADAVFDDSIRAQVGDWYGRLQRAFSQACC